jgi:hypothetical protein
VADSESLPLELAHAILHNHVDNALTPNELVTRKLLDLVHLAMGNSMTLVRRPPLLAGRHIKMAEQQRIARAFLEGHVALTPEQVSDLAAMVIAGAAIINDDAAVKTTPPTTH